MARDELINKRNEIYSGSPSVIWTMAFFCAFSLLGCLALDLLVPSISIITIPILFAPVLFGSFAIAYTIKFGGTVKIGNTFRICTTYFASPNFGCFNLLKNLLKSFLVYFVASLLFSILLNIVFTNMYGQEFIGSMNLFLEISMNETDPLVIEIFLNSESLFNNYIDLSNGFSLICGVIFFMYSIVYSSISLYLRINLQNAPSMAVKGLVNQFFKTNKKDYFKDFWYLNWPLFILMLLGFGIGSTLTIIFKLDYINICTLSALVATVFMAPYLPYLFANMETLFDKYGPKFQEVGNKMARDAVEHLRRRTDISEEEKKKIEEMIEESNKKDSNDSGSEEP